MRSPCNWCALGTRILTGLMRPLAVNLSRRVPREEMRLHVEMACDHGAESRAPDAYMNPKVIMSAGRY